MLDYCIFIGRFQPFTIAHEATVRKALEEANQVIVFIGSAQASQSPKNPFTLQERKSMIFSCFADNEIARITVIFIKDSAYNFNSWLKEVQEKVNSISGNNKNIGIIGYLKDASSYYLKYFPQYKFISMPNIENGLSATQVRDKFFSIQPFWRQGLNQNVVNYLEQWLFDNKERFNALCKEWNYIDTYKKSWYAAPYPPIFVTTDIIVICQGHILVIKRKRNPGIGLYALPGGFLEQNETVEQGALRELKEETKIDVSIKVLQGNIKQVHVFDMPGRDPRGRTITHAHLIILNGPLPQIKADDDAAEVLWMPLYQIDQNDSLFFNDHWSIIKYFLGSL